MQLLDSYLKGVKRCLPRAQAADIIKELSDDLRSQIEERESILGRPMTDDEVAAFLMQHGDPMTVARRYRQYSHSLTIGWELIGPELFPMYLIILCVNLVITVACTAIFFPRDQAQLTLNAFTFPALVQITCTTLVFIVMNAVRRKFPKPWYYPPSEIAVMLPVVKEYCVAGLILWVPVLLWWLAIPHFPSLILGSAASHLQLAPSWHNFYVPMLLLILASVSQRVLNLFRPNWTFLVPVMRLVINAASVPILYFLVFKSSALVVVADGFKGIPQYENLAVYMNGTIRWGILGPWLWIYAGIGALIYAWYSRPHFRKFFRGKRNAASAQVL